MQVTLNLNEGLSNKDFVAKTRQSVAIEAYKTGKFPLGSCVELSGMFYSDFLKLLSENKIALFNLEDVEDDFKTIKNI